MRPIDADALLSMVCEFYTNYERANRLVFSACEIKQMFADMLNETPTIEQPQWIPVTESLPDCEWGAECPEPVIYKMKATGTVYAGYYGTGGLCRDRYFRQYHKINTNGVDVDDVACWMYQSALPEPPKGDE